MPKLQTVIFLVRHGQTDLPYVADPELDDQRQLTKEGRAQLKKVGEYLKSFAPSVIFSSPRQRTIESAEIIKQITKTTSKVVIAVELLEIYNTASYVATERTVPDFLVSLVKKHAGAQIVCVSHMDVIEGALRGFKVTADEAKLPCGMADVYRLVFAGETFVECTKLQPAKT